MKDQSINNLSQHLCFYPGSNSITHQKEAEIKPCTKKASDPLLQTPWHNPPHERLTGVLGWAGGMV